MKSRRKALSCVTLMGLFCAHPGLADRPGLPEILPSDLETEIALSAAPKHLRSGASVYLLRKEGYEVARHGTNGFSCLVVRGPGLGPPAWDDSISGWCYDEHGMETMGRVTLDRARYRRQGLTANEIRDKINAGFASGLYRSPGRAGVIYMLSPINKVPDHRTGKLFDYVPHLMYYAPDITNDDIGVPEEIHKGNPDYVWSGLPYLPSTGPHGFIVQPLGEKESARIIAEHRDLIARVRHYVDLDLIYE